jgi:hypothetical protein
MGRVWVESALREDKEELQFMVKELIVLSTSNIVS